MNEDQQQPAEHKLIPQPDPDETWSVPADDLDATWPVAHVAEHPAD